MVNINRYTILPNECWQWSGAIASNGYGVLYFQGKMHKAHRLMYKLHKGELIEGLVIDHTCNNRACVNPEHLRQVPQKVNALATHSNSIGRIYAERNSCKNGHEFNEMNTYHHPDGSRRCRECHRLWSKQHRVRAKALK